MSFFEELKRRNVIRVGIAYAVGAWLLLQLTDVLSELLDLSGEVGPVVVTLVLVGFPVVLLAAWVFELTPDGIKRESEIDRETSITGKTGRKLDRAIIVVLTLAVGYLLLDKLVLQGPMDRDDTAAAERAAQAPSVDESASVAVLPFVNMSNDPDNEYFSDGLTDTLLHMLAQLPDLRVAARTSSFAFKNQNRAIPEIAAALGVAHVLEGSVQRAGDQVRITAQLIRAEDGFHLWSENYTRPLEDIFRIQDEIATDVAQALGASLLGDRAVAIQGVETDDLTAYDRYLKGIEQQEIGSYGSLDTAQNHLEQALTEDSAFTDARLALVRNYILKRLTGMITTEELHRLAPPLLNQVLESHPDNKLAQAYGAMINGRFSNSQRTRAQVQKAIYRNRDLLAYVPTDSLMRTSVALGLHFVLDESDAALALLEAGLLIDPLDAEIHTNRAMILMDMERLEEAESSILNAIDLAPENPAGFGLMADLKQSQGDLPGALGWLRQTMAIDPQDHEVPYEMAYLLYAMELDEAAEPYFSRVQALAPGSAMARLLEVLRARARGEDDRAIALAESMIADQVDTRRGVFYLATVHFTDLMLDAGRSREAFDALVALRPGLDVWEAVPEDAHLNIMRRFAILLMTGFATFEERQQAWNAFRTGLESTGFEIAEAGSSISVQDAIINGVVERAVTEQIEHRMSDSIADAPWRHHPVMDVLYKPMLDDPRMMAAMNERKRQAAEVRGELETLLLQPEWNP